MDVKTVLNESSPYIMALVRHGVQAAAVCLGTYGVTVSNSGQEQAVMSITSGIIFVMCTAWSIYQKKQQKVAVAVALNTPVPEVKS